LQQYNAILTQVLPETYHYDGWLKADSKKTSTFLFITDKKDKSVQIDVFM